MGIADDIFDAEAGQLGEICDLTRRVDTFRSRNTALRDTLREVRESAATIAAIATPQIGCGAISDEGEAALRHHAAAILTAIDKALEKDNGCS